MSKLSRRQFNQALAGGAVAVPLSMLTTGIVSAYEPPMADPEATVAKALKYVLVAPEEGVNCASCALYQAKEDATVGTCTIFFDVLVSGEAWCTAYQPKN